MFTETLHGDGGIEVVFSSELSSVDRAVAVIKRHLARWCPGEIFDVLLVVRELLNNAVEHGNRFRPDLTVTCRVDRLEGRRLQIMVSDQGEGFRHGDAECAMPSDPLTDRNRGLALVRAFSERLTFNDVGNRASVRIACGSGDLHPSEPRGRNTMPPLEDGEHLRITEGERSIEIIVRSEVHRVERVLRTVLSFADRIDPTPFPALEQVLRELLVNAVVHGNRRLPEEQVFCAVEQVRDNLFRVVVADDGTGFDHRNAPGLISQPPPADRGGFGLLRSLCEQIDFNAAGNRVTVHLRRPVQTRFDISRREDRGVIRPSGDITAASADELKASLTELAASGISRYTFDFAQVGEIDSVGLTLFVVFVKMLAKRGDRPDLEIVNISHNLRKLFTMTRLDARYRLV